MSTTASKPTPSSSSAATKPALILINGSWVAADSNGTFQATNPALGSAIEEQFPISKWSDCEKALNAAVEAFEQMRSVPRNRIADFLELYASKIEAKKEALVAKANEESGLPKAPRLADVELPRTTNQLKQAAAAVRSGSWAMATIDTKANLRSVFEPIGPVCVFGPNNFPFAFNSVAGGDFTSAIAAGNPVIGKANSSHPGVSRMFAEIALEAVRETNLPLGLVQLIYRTSHEDGLKLVSDIRVGATGYTGSRHAGLNLKAAADANGKPFYAELSSVNPVVFLPGAVAERGEKLAEEYATSGLMATGQFCTNPGLVLMIDNEKSRTMFTDIVHRYSKAEPGTLLSKAVQSSLTKGVSILKEAGAKLLVGGSTVEGNRCAVANTILEASGEQFLQNPEEFQTEVFGNAALFIFCSDVDQLKRVLENLEGNLTGSIYSANDGSDDAHYDQLSGILISKVGRFLNDKMPTGVAVSIAMNHGGPYPATGHPGFTAVGIPASMVRFAKLTCYDSVRAHRLPALLKNENPTGSTWRNIDGKWTTEAVPTA